MSPIQFISSFMTTVWDFLSGYKMPILNISYASFLVATIMINVAIGFLRQIGFGGGDSGGIRGGNSKREASRKRGSSGND